MRALPQKQVGAPSKAWANQKGMRLVCLRIDDHRRKARRSPDKSCSSPALRVERGNSDEQEAGNEGNREPGGDGNPEAVQYLEQTGKMYGATLRAVRAHQSHGSAGTFTTRHRAESHQVVAGGDTGEECYGGQKDCESSPATIAEPRMPAALPRHEHPECYKYTREPEQIEPAGNSHGHPSVSKCKSAVNRTRLSN